MKWHTKTYHSIIENARTRAIIPGVYYEKHHIQPRSLGGLDTNNNLVYLTAREHFICHMLLVHMHTGQDRHKMLHALNAFRMNNKHQQRITSRIYASLKQELKEVYSQNMLENNPMHNKTHKETHALAMQHRVNVGMSGKKHSENTKQKMKAARAKQVITEETKRKLSKSRIEASKDPNYVNGCRVGWYITPWGRFKSLTLAAEGQSVNRISIKNWCRINNDKKVTKLNLRGKSIFTENDIGKTFAELGFGFEEL